MVTSTLLFQFSMFLDEFGRPIVILVCAMALFNLPILLYKIELVIQTLRYLLFCHDKTWKKPQDPGLVFATILQAKKPTERKTIYFVRHGESTWNDTFNKGKHRSALTFVLGFIPGILKAIAYELYLLLSGKMDSWFYDSPLSFLGLDQVEELANFLESEGRKGPESEHIRILRSDPGSPSSKIISSNLRRAISTMAGGFRERLKRRPADKIFLVSSLQEISRNPDALCITPAHAPVQASWMEKTSKVCNFQELFATQVDSSRHTGNKAVDSTGYGRMTDFCQYVFSPAVRDNHVIVGGHSLWFKSFFQMFLPFTIKHVSKEKKIVNGGVVTFELMKASTQYGDKYMIDPESIKVVYGGF